MHRKHRCATTTRFLLVSSLLLFLVFGSGGLGDANAAEGAEDLSQPSGVEAFPRAQEPERLREVVELRDADSRTYELATGQMEWVSNGSPIHYQDSAGRWQEIDNGLTADSVRVGGVDYAYRNAANSSTVRFGAETSETQVRVEHEGKSITFGPTGARRAGARKDADLGTGALAYMAVSENCISYCELYPGVDMIYEPTGTGVREYLVLKNADVQNEFVFSMKLEGVAAEESEGGIVFVDENGEKVFWMGSPYLMDGSLETSNEVSYSLSGQGHNLRLTVTVSRDYLEDPDRVYPVVLDPDVYWSGDDIWQDTYICSYGNQTSHAWETMVRTGYNSTSGKRRTLIKFDLPHINWQLLNYGYLRIEQCYQEGSAPVMYAYPCNQYWSPSAETWDGPGYNSNWGVSSQNYWSGSGWWWHLYTTEPIVQWLHNGGDYDGWMIIDPHAEQYYDRAGWFYSKEAGSPHRPELHLVYNYEQVDVHMVCDGVFRSAAGSSWSTIACNAMERVDDQMAKEFGIKFNVQTPASSWYSLIDECSNKPDCSLSHATSSYAYEHLEPSSMLVDALGCNRNGADILASVTGAMRLRIVELDPYCNISCAGMAFEPSDGILAAYSPDWESLWKYLQHEVCHLFGALDHHGPPATYCVEYVTGDLRVPYADMWCEPCALAIQENALKY